MCVRARVSVKRLCGLVDTFGARVGRHLLICQLAGKKFKSFSDCSMTSESEMLR